MSNNAIDVQRDNIVKTIEELRDNRWRDFNDTIERYERQLALLDDIESGKRKVAETAITYEDLILAFNEMQVSRTEYKNLTEEEEQARIRCRRAYDELRSCSRKVERGAATKEELEEAQKRFTKAEEGYDPWWGTEDWAVTVGKAGDRKNNAERVWNAVRMLYVKQCKVVAMAAMVADTSWTKQPVRYKRMRNKVHVITDEALAGTGCEVTVYESGSVHINLNSGAFFTYVEHGDSDEIPTWEDRNELAQVEDMFKTLEAIRKYESTRLTVPDVIKLVEAYREAMHEVVALKHEYEGAVGKLIEPYKVLNMTDDLRRAARTIYY